MSKSMSVWAAGAAAGLVTIGIVGGVGMGRISDQPQPGSAAPDGAPAKPAGAAAGQPGGFSPEMAMGLVKAMKETPGCLSVEIATCASRKQVIFGFFKDKASVMAWYNDKHHQAAMDMVAPGRDKTKVPMAEVPEDVGPVMAVASITAGAGEGGMPKLAIELYSPLKAGLKLPGGGFAPDAFEELIKKK